MRRRLEDVVTRAFLRRWKTVMAVTLAALAFLVATPSVAQSDEWRFSAGLYLWLPTVNGQLKYSLPPGGGGSPAVEIGPNSYLTHLKFAAPLFGEARKGDWSIFTDILYLSLTAENSRVTAADLTIPVDVDLNLRTESSQKGLEWTQVGGHSAVKGSGGELDVIAGLRYLHVKAETDWELTADITRPGGGIILTRTGHVSESVGLWDGIVGVRGRINLGTGKWSLPYYADIGTGSSSLTWQAYAGVSYGFGWGNVGLVYRHLGYDQRDDKLLQNFRMSGLALYSAFHF